MKLDLGLQSVSSFLSPRKYGISKRVQHRFLTEDDKKDQEVKIDSKELKGRIPGKIKKNIG